MNIKLQITHTETKEVTITVPSFWKDPCTYYDCYRAVLDEKTFVEIQRLWDGETVDIQHSVVHRKMDKIAQAHSNYNIVSESEFMQAYDDAWESLRMRPMVIDTGREQAQKELMQTENY